MATAENHWKKAQAIFDAEIINAQTSGFIAGVVIGVLVGLTIGLLI